MWKAKDERWSHILSPRVADTSAQIFSQLHIPPALSEEHGSLCRPPAPPGPDGLLPQAGLLHGSGPGHPAAVWPQHGHRQSPGRAGPDRSWPGGQAGTRDHRVCAGAQREPPEFLPHRTAAFDLSICRRWGGQTRGGGCSQTHRSWWEQRGHEVRNKSKHQKLCIIPSQICSEVTSPRGSQRFRICIFVSESKGSMTEITGP